MMVCAWWILIACERKAIAILFSNLNSIRFDWIRFYFNIARERVAAMIYVQVYSVHTTWRWMWIVDCGNAGAKMLRYDCCFGSMLFVRSVVFIFIFSIVSLLLLFVCVRVWVLSSSFLVLFVICWTTEEWNYTRQGSRDRLIECFNSTYIMVSWIYTLLTSQLMYGALWYEFHYSISPIRAIKMKNWVSANEFESWRYHMYRRRVKVERGG